jgi:hypothetical protein
VGWTYEFFIRKVIINRLNYLCLNVSERVDILTVRCVHDCEWRLQYYSIISQQHQIIADEWQFGHFAQYRAHTPTFLSPAQHKLPITFLDMSISRRLRKALVQYVFLVIFN